MIVLGSFSREIKASFISGPLLEHKAIKIFLDLNSLQNMLMSKYCELNLHSCSSSLTVG